MKFWLWKLTIITYLSSSYVDWLCTVQNKIIECCGPVDIWANICCGFFLYRQPGTLIFPANHQQIVICGFELVCDFCFFGWMWFVWNKLCIKRGARLCVNKTSLQRLNIICVINPAASLIMNTICICLGIDKFLNKYSINRHGDVYAALTRTHNHRINTAV